MSKHELAEKIIRFRAEQEARLMLARRALRARGLALAVPAPMPGEDPVERNLALLEAAEQAEAQIAALAK